MDDPKHLLDSIVSPRQLRGMSPDDLSRLAEEIRARIIDVVSRQGGHLASNLGVTELTIALHSVFDFEHDRLLWDVGHQCYPHKLLTGRAKDFDSLRQRGGISGFPSPAESPYDLFATGHAGTAISTAAGLAWADAARGEDRKAVAVVGDASIVNGLSLEALNNVATMQRQFLIILNDNSMAIDRTQGGLARVLDDFRSTPTYSEMKHSAEHLLQQLPLGDEISEALRNLKEGVKLTLHGRQVFSALGIDYFGPVDGHDIQQLIRMLRRISRIDCPVLLHVHTEKGRGARYAVEDPCRFHSPSAYEHRGDQAVVPTRCHPSWTKAFSDALVDAATEDESIVAITAAMPDGTGLVKFRETYPDRYLDVGINESHGIALAGGLAKSGLRPVVAIYSTFMQRAFDQVFEELCLQKLPCVVCMDRAGLVGSDGAVHHGFADIAYLRPLPGITLMAPADAAELRAALATALSLDAPAAIRYPRDEILLELEGECPPFVPGKARTVVQGNDATLLCYGSTVEHAMAAANMLRREHSLDVGVVNARFAKPLDEEMICGLLASGRPIVVTEDHARIGGFGSAVLELAAERGLNTSRVRLLGIPDRFVSHGQRQEQLTEAGLDATTMARTVRSLLDGPARKT